MKTKWTTENIPSQAGRRAVFTGANSGIGFEAALALAHKGAELILPARTQGKADDAAARILHSRNDDTHENAGVRLIVHFGHSS
jgi:NAD(P)-dependent dehydrogenase (short-subunit alcohol dehydrogenase family)